MIKELNIGNYTKLNRFLNDGYDGYTYKLMNIKTDEEFDEFFNLISDFTKKNYEFIDFGDFIYDNVRWLSEEETEFKRNNDFIIMYDDDNKTYSLFELQMLKDYFNRMIEDISKM